MTGGDLVTRALQRRGVNTVFSLAGGAHNWLLESLDHHGVRIIGGRHESASVLQADGYSRITGKVGVSMIIAQQGLANAIGGLGASMDACSPVVVIVARSPLAADDPGMTEDVDELALARPVTKWTRTVHDPSRLGEYVEEACRRALSGRPGPVVLAIPSNYFNVKFETEPVDEQPITEAARPEPLASAVDRAADLISGAERPLVIAGTGAAWGKAGPSLLRLAKDFRIPVFGDMLGRGLVPEDLEVGFSWHIAQTVAKEADVVLAVGARLTKRLGFGRPPRFAEQAQFIQIDIDPEELGRSRHVAVPIAADAGVAAFRIVEALQDRGFDGAGGPAWVRDALAVRLARIGEVGLGDEAPIHPYRMARELMAILPENAIIVGDGADANNWAQGILRVRQAPGYMDQQPYGSMGMSLPLAVGAVAGAQEVAKEEGGEPRPVFLFTGDGSFGFYPAELNSAEQAGLPFVTLISNDGGWGTERHGQTKAGLTKTINCDFGNSRYDLLAESFGCHGELVEHPADIAPALQRALAADRPAVLNCITDRMAGHLRKQDALLQTVLYNDATAAKQAEQARAKS